MKSWDSNNQYEHFNGHLKVSELQYVDKELFLLIIKFTF
jgi:hypothetical protein